MFPVSDLGSVLRKHSLSKLLLKFSLNMFYQTEEAIIAGQTGTIIPKRSAQLQAAYRSHPAKMNISEVTPKYSSVSIQCSLASLRAALKPERKVLTIEALPSLEPVPPRKVEGQKRKTKTPKGGRRNRVAVYEVERSQSEDRTEESDEGDGDSEPRFYTAEELGEMLR